MDTYTTDRNVIKIIVGNKSDKDSTGSREVPTKEGEALAKQMETLFIETSAKTTAGVQEAFREVVRKVIFYDNSRLWKLQGSGSHHKYQDRG